MAVAFLKDASVGRLVSGHPWVYSTDILRIEKAPEDGGEIMVRSSDGAYVGNGFYNSKSRIPIRIFSRSKEKLDRDFFKKRILNARRIREDLKSEGISSKTGALPEACRLIWSEADFLPGLIVDRYDDALVMQTLTLALDQRKEMIRDLLVEAFEPKTIVERNDVPSRQFEGLDLHKEVVFGSSRSALVVRMGWAKYEVDLLEGQKTGSYLDQVFNHIAVGKMARGQRVLDCFTYHGGFALHAALGGAKEVEAIDISEHAIQKCERNAQLNQLEIKWKAANVFDELNARQRAKEKFDFIVLDPPSFTKTRSKLQEALRGYKEIHLRALKLLNEGGLLATFCCSHHVDTETFRAVILDAAFDARKILRLRNTFSQSPDHPVIPSIPETEYLKGFLLEIV